MNKKSIIIFVLFFIFFPVLAHDGIKELSSFKIMGVIDLRNEPGFNNKVEYQTLNHEFGFEVRVLEFGEKDKENGKNGQWLKVLTTAPMWTESWEWIDANKTFWIFLPDDEDIFEYEE